MVEVMRLVVLGLLAVVTFSTVPRAEACERCERDGSVSVTVSGEFVRYQRTRFTLHVKVVDDRREWVDQIAVVPMALPEHNGEAMRWSALRPGDRLEVHIRETEQERVVVRVVLRERAPASA